MALVAYPRLGSHSLFAMPSSMMKLCIAQHKLSGCNGIVLELAPMNALRCKKPHVYWQAPSSSPPLKPWQPL